MKKYKFFIKIDKNLFLGIFIFLTFIFLFNPVFAQSFYGSRTGTASFVDFQQYYRTPSGAGGTYISDIWPILGDEERKQCEARQDLLLQISPFGCQPAVVRSDLLAEQNVPVFCQIDALRLNPLIDIKQVRNIRFTPATGKYPDSVVGVGFHPSRAALRTSGNQLIGDPFLNNLGYIVIVLKKQPDEKKQPKFINFTLSAQVDYYAGNAFGVGKTNFLLKKVDDEGWKIENKRQSFLDGKYSIRLIDADENKVTVALYSGDRRVSIASATRQKPSNDIYVPGTYCRPALKIYYDGLKVSTIVARFKVGEDIIDVPENGRFANNLCVVSKIHKTGNEEGNVEVLCNGERIIFKISQPKLVEDDEVHIIQNGNIDYDKKYKIKEVIKNDSGVFYKLVETVDNNLSFKIVKSNEAISVSPEKLHEAVYNDDYEKAFREAINAYKAIVEDYPLEKENIEGLPSYGEMALESAFKLAEDSMKYKTAMEIANLHKINYPSSKRLDFEKFFKTDFKNSAISVQLGPRVETIKLISINEPVKKPKAIFTWGTERFSIEFGETKKINGYGNISLENVVPNRVFVNIKCANEEDKNKIQKKELRIDNLERRTETICASVLRIEDIEFEQYANVRIEGVARGPTIETNITVGVGIEKRAIKLTPDKTKERINELNNTIKKWEKISTNLGNVVKGMKGACLATAGILTVKNFVTGLSGEALARQKVMRGENGWTKKCAELVSIGEFDSMTQCYNAKSSEIDRDVRTVSRILENTNKDVRDIESMSGIKISSGLAGSYIDDNAAYNAFVNNKLSRYNNLIINVDGNNVSVHNLTKPIGGRNILSYRQAIEMQTYLKLRDEAQRTNSFVLRDIADAELKKIANFVIDVHKSESARLSASSIARGTGLENVDVTVIGSRPDIPIQEYTGGILREGDFGISGKSGKPAQLVVVNNEQYIVILNEASNDRYFVDSVYYTNGQIASNQDSEKIKTILGNGLRKVDSRSCNNKFIEPKIQFYESEPYKGMPAIVPFDLNQGWYVATQQTLPGFEGIKAFDSSGRPVSFWICNVGKNGRAEFLSGVNDDICRQFNVDTRAPIDKFSCLSESQTRQLVNRAINALNEAGYKRQQGKVSGGYSITIDGQSIPVGPPATNIPGTECQDFMSPDDCKILFNVCDPVICPNSRCNLGGTYYVSDVIQSGIVGSLLLCLPNIKEGIYVPVCLTGVKAGIDGFLSILKSHQKCLQENLETGEYVGTCDLITSVYLCEFFWRQAAPIANLAVPKLIEFVYTGGGVPRGGGEYLTVQHAWDNAQSSINYFVQTYAVNSFEAFKIRSYEEAGSTFCKAFISAKGPKTFESLIESDSPPQFHAWFSQVPYSDVTVPATAQYKVFYHIFAGNNRGVHFSIYLKDPPQISYYQTTPIIVVASGFVSKGQAETQTRDFTAPANYGQLCVRINDREECGFKEVSTNFAINYIKDKLVNETLKERNIRSTQECVSGRSSLANAFNPNLQNFAQEIIDPAIYNRGIVRICATDNPGKSTDPLRFIEVGYCDDIKIKCWLDSESISKSISIGNIGLRNATLSEIEKEAREQIKKQSNFLYLDGEDREINDISDKVSRLTQNYNSETAKLLFERIDELAPKLILNSQKAKLALVRAKISDAKVRSLLRSNRDVRENIQINNQSDNKTDSTNENNVPRINSIRFLKNNLEVSEINTGDVFSIEIVRNENCKDVLVILYKEVENEEFVSRTVLRDNALIWKPEIIRREGIYFVKTRCLPGGQEERFNNNKLIVRGGTTGQVRRDIL